MLFAIGSKVRLRYTGESGVIVGLLDDSMLQVRLDSDPDLLIPTFEEDLEPYTGAAPLIFVPGKKAEPPQAPPRRELKAQYIILKPKGLQLACEPMPGRDGSVTRYKVWLLNDTLHEFLVELDLYTSTRDVLRSDEKIAAATALELGDLLYDDLNDTPEVWLSVRRITTAGTDAPIERSQKIRPKQFFNTLQTAPVLNVLAYSLVLLDSFEPQPQRTDTEDLKTYTRQNLRAHRSKSGAKSGLYRPFDVEEFAHFVPEIDLHIQNLHKGYARLDKGEILRIQMLHFHQFLDKAIRLGIPRVFVIHGVGEGKLRDAIADSLRRHPDVHRFKNEYHHKYGYGATEVVFTA
jgi:hypothetical protein